jgi:hypothetical protein
VGDNFQYQGGSVHWDVTFSRLAQDWELESFASFLELLYSFKVKGIGADTVVVAALKIYRFPGKILL